MKKILMLLADNYFRDIEFIGPHAFFKQKGYQIDTTAKTNISKGRFGYEVKHKKILQEVDPQDYDGLFMVGGAGVLDYKEDSEALNLVSHFAKHKVLGAICTAPSLLIYWGLANGREITGCDCDGSLTELCKNYPEVKLQTLQKTVIDKNIITANGPQVSEAAANGFSQLLESDLQLSGT